jgi:flagellar biosynthesis GTPase FlhF
MAENMMALSDEQAIEYGFAPASATPEATNVVETVTPAVVESAVAATPATAEKPADSTVPKPTTDTPKEGDKALYTPEEIEEILKSDGTLDSSRLDANGKILQKSFQRGTTQKFEQAKREREEAAKMKAEVERIRSEFEQAKREAENQRLFEKEAEELGEEAARTNKERRDMQERLERLESENRQARNRAATMQIESEYRSVSPKFNIPQGEVFGNIILGSIVGNDLRGQDGTPRTIAESAELFANELGLTDGHVDNLLRIVKANPNNYAAIKNTIINEYNQEKAKGPTVSPSSSANVQSAPKKPSDEVDPNASTMDAVRKLLGVPDGENINLI